MPPCGATTGTTTRALAALPAYYDGSATTAVPVVPARQGFLFVCLFDLTAGGLRSLLIPGGLRPRQGGKAGLAAGHMPRALSTIVSARESGGIADVFACARCYSWPLARAHIHKAPCIYIFLCCRVTDPAARGPVTPNPLPARSLGIGLRWSSPLRLGRTCLVHTGIAATPKRSHGVSVCGLQLEPWHGAAQEVQEAQAVVERASESCALILVPLLDRLIV